MVCGFFQIVISAMSLFIPDVHWSDTLLEFDVHHSHRTTDISWSVNSISSLFVVFHKDYPDMSQLEEIVRVIREIVDEFCRLLKSFPNLNSYENMYSEFGF